ncbi:AAA family ATPase [Corynebacterium sp. ES2794-CONJ1]|uniref:AAA family ATPase n=1 Tax=unclassified Corynebacterium TaxID=2624378 RepID=UPI002169BB9B|nr:MULTISPECIES: AAA family ATPase [unclassified Corynebacterium]MCS4489843.1 AAA family ATPase [Corynebacterium sp. ES2775-CONJ]MCU9519299.1 AAA family ATPase [Corynebacterium sp. ES2794-CONJ1]
MDIQRIELKNIRGINHLILDDLPATGVIMISGDNEAGKSTILEAIRIALDMKATSKSKNVKALKPLDRDEAPEIWLHFRLGEHKIELYKQYLKAPKTELKVDNRSYTADDAEDQLEQLKQRYIDPGLFRALYNQQDQMDDDLVFADIKPLEDTLRADLDEDASPDHGNELIKRAFEEYSRFYQRTGRETTEVKNARQAVQEAQQNFEAKKKKLSDLSTYIAEYDKQQRHVTESEKALPTYHDHVSELAEQVAEIESAENKLLGLKEDFERAQEALKHSIRECKRRQELQAACAELAQELAQLRKDIIPIAQAADKEHEELEALRTRRGDLTDQLKQLREEIKTLKERIERTAAGELAREATETLEKIREVEETIARLAQVPHIENSVLKQLEQAWENFNAASIKAEAQSTVLSLSARSDTELLVDGQDVAVGRERRDYLITKPLTLEIGDITAEITPGAGSVQRERDDSEAKWQELKDAAGVETIEQAREIFHAGQEATRSIVSYRSTLKELTKERTHAELSQLIAAAPQDEDEDSSADLSAELHLLEKSKEEKEEERECLDAQITDSENSPQAQLLQSLSSTISAKEAVLQREELYLESAEAEVSSLVLDQQRESAETMVEKTRQKWEAAKKQLDLLDIENKKRALEVAQAKVTNTKESLRRAEQEIARMAGYIEQADGAGTDYDLACDHLSQAERKLEAIESRAAAAKLLYQILLSHQKLARERYALPFAQKLNSLARIVWGPDVNFELSEKLQVLARTGMGGVRVEQGELSGGAKEQLNILSRLAVASLVSEQSIPVFFDDVLGSTDATRLDAMAAVFNQLAKTQQIFVLTCVPSRYQGVTQCDERPLALLKK